jgi:alpha-beta hydrolase superfamily lysophospholipase
VGLPNEVGLLLVVAHSVGGVVVLVAMERRENTTKNKRKDKKL